MALLLISKPFGDAEVGRGLHIRFQVQKESTSGVWSGKDISGAQWTYRVRAWVVASPTATVFDEALTKDATDSATGWIDHYLSLGATAYATALRWEIVEVDNNNADAATKTGKREVSRLKWSQAITAAPTS